MFTASDITYDAGTHTSRDPEGRDVPHVTRILSATGVSTDFGEVAALGPRVAANVELAKLRGTAVHADCHAYDDDDLDAATVHDLVRPFLGAWIVARENLGLTPLVHARERHVYHAVHNYTGIQDGIFTRRGLRRRILVDLKTGDPEDAAAHLQTAAYEAAWALAHPGEPVDERWAIWLRPDRRVPYTIVDYSGRPDGWQDFGKFQAVLCTFNEQPGRRRRIS